MWKQNGKINYESLSINMQHRSMIMERQFFQWSMTATVIQFGGSALCLLFVSHKNSILLNKTVSTRQPCNQTQHEHLGPRHSSLKWTASSIKPISYLSWIENHLRVVWKPKVPQSKNWKFFLSHGRTENLLTNCPKKNSRPAHLVLVEKVCDPTTQESHLCDLPWSPRLI